MTITADVHTGCDTGRDNGPDNGPVVAPRPSDGRATPELQEHVALVDRLRIAEGVWSAAAARIPDGALTHLLWASIVINGGSRIAAAPPSARCARPADSGDRP